MNLRYFDYYDKNGRLPMQQALLESLEKNGFENGSHDILTQVRVGVPVTMMLLLMTDAISVLESEQKELQKDLLDHDPKTTGQVVRTLGLQPIKGYGSEDSWGHRTIRTISPQFGVSGFSFAVNSELYYPKERIGYKLPDVFKSPAGNIQIDRDSILVSPENQQEKTLISVVKNVIQFFEFAYAVRERVQSELNNYNKFLNSKVGNPVPVDEYAQVCGMRGSIIHEGNIKLDISKNDNALTLGDRLLIEIFRKALDSACNWINETYRKMLEDLEKKSR